MEKIVKLVLIFDRFNFILIVLFIIDRRLASRFFVGNCIYNHRPVLSRCVL